MWNQVIDVVHITVWHSAIVEVMWSVGCDELDFLHVDVFDLDFRDMADCEQYGLAISTLEITHILIMKSNLVSNIYNISIEQLH